MSITQTDLQKAINWDLILPNINSVSFYSGANYISTFNRPPKAHDYHKEALNVAFPQTKQFTFEPIAKRIEEALRAAHLRGERREPSK